MMMNATMAATTTGTTTQKITTTMATTTHEPFENILPALIIQAIGDDIPEFEVVLPCIFGIFMILSLSLIVFYSKEPFTTDSSAGAKQVEAAAAPVENGSVPHL